MQSKIKVGIIGGAGYTGGELIRLLLHHPYATIHFVHSNSHAEQPITSVHTDLIGETTLVFSNTLLQDADVYFLCVGHGAAKKFLEENTISPSIRIIDLSQDFRLKQHAQMGNRTFVYGLPELNKKAIQTAHHIANPGCFATTIELGLLPLANAGILADVFTTGITGSTGAGQAPSATTHFSWRANNISAYKTLQHQHLHEIGETLEQLQGNDGIAIHFIPWRGDFARGIFVSSMIDCAFPLHELKEMYQLYYKDAAFTYVADNMIDLKQVVNTNKCVIHLEKQGNKLVVHSALDNLLKGASGQAVQNMNLLFGFPETAGLQLKAAAF
jgi:N-acetyl-gamma-glutamyl-phosphate reductase